MSMDISNESEFDILRRKTGLAFRVLRRNYGCPGVDGLSIKDIKKDFVFHNGVVNDILSSVDTWNFSPSIRQIETGNITRTSRTVCVYGLHERWALETVRLSIASWFSARLRGSVFSCVRGSDRRKTLNHILDCNPSFIMILDVKQCSANICAIKLRQKLERDGFSSKWVNITMNCLHSPLAGVPPGNPLSQVVINYYLTAIDDLFTSGYARFSDDLIVSLGELAEIKPTAGRISAELGALNLELNNLKTRIHRVSDRLVAIPEYPWFCHSVS
jgi:hypothetical protein